MQKLAVVGVGRWGKNILRVLDNISDVRYCCDKSRENLEYVRENYPSINSNENLEDILDDEYIDAVAIATPPNTHYDIVEKCLNSGKDVFVEKPLTGDAEKSKKLEKLADEKGSKLFVGYIFIHHPVYQEIKDISKEEGLNKIRSSWRKTGSFRDSIFHTLVCHDIALGLSLTDSFTNFSIEEAYKTGDRLDRIRFSMNSSNFDFSGEYDRVFPGKRKLLCFETERGNLYVWEDESLLKFDEDENEFEEVFSSGKEALKAELEAFIQYIGGDGDVVTDASFGRRVDEALKDLESTFNQ